MGREPPGLDTPHNAIFQVLRVRNRFFDDDCRGSPVRHYRPFDAHHAGKGRPVDQCRLITLKGFRCQFSNPGADNLLRELPGNLNRHRQNLQLRLRRGRLFRAFRAPGDPGQRQQKCHEPKHPQTSAIVHNQKPSWLSRRIISPIHRRTNAFGHDTDAYAAIASDLIRICQSYNIKTLTIESGL